MVNKIYHYTHLCKAILRKRDKRRETVSAPVADKLRRGFSSTSLALLCQPIQFRSATKKEGVRETHFELPK
ncbi:MAG: hypothetical protein A2007_02775 [Verrucomicrobia bacterium GWC2_42_7]|nr:MAG: hypothetical protein A2007_02775 [Verrucomicrobia bacterium GWC2_42_7]